MVGSKNSSNSVRLTEISETSGTKAYLVDDRSEMQRPWFDGVETVLVTAGASAPEYLVQEIIQALVDDFGGQTEESHAVAEDMHFELPLSLRTLRDKSVNSAR